MFIVTGAAGFIGSAFVWELNKRGVSEIICVDQFHQSQKWRNLAKRSFFHFVMKDDLFDFLSQTDVIGAVKGVFHMGACSSTTQTDVDYLVKNNYYYSQELFKWCSRHQKRFIYASSAATYGAGENGFEDTFDSEKLKPLNLYGESKVIMDRWVVKQKLTPPHWYALKFFNVFGPNEYEKGSMASVAFKAFHQVSEKSELGLFKSYNAQYADGQQLRDFVYVKDVVRWMKELMDKKPENGIYNMGFGKARSWLDMAQALFAALGKPLKINWLEMPDNIKDQYQYFTEANMNKWKSQGLSEPEWSLEKAIADYVQNYLQKEEPWL